MKKIAFYPGSFDPMTNGHVDILRQALGLFDELIVGVGIHPGKVPMFDFDERAALIREAVQAMDLANAQRIRVQSFDNLVVEAARQAGAKFLVRGLRDGTDFDFEMQMAGMNKVMAGDVTTIFFPASAQVRSITATLVRQISKLGGDVSPFVPENVLAALNVKIR